MKLFRTEHERVNQIVNKRCRKGNWVYVGQDKDPELDLYVCDFCGTFCRAKRKKDLPRQCGWCGQKNHDVIQWDEYLKKF